MQDQMTADQDAGDQMIGGQMMTSALTISALIDHALKYHGDTAISSVETAGGISTTTWAGVARNARRLASALAGMGIAPGQRCATMAWNNRRHLECYFGISGGGQVMHTLNPRLFPEQPIYVINHAEDQLLFVDQTFLPIVAAVAPRLETVRAFVLLGPRDEEAAAQMPDLLFFDELLQQGDAQFQWPDLDENAAASLCYTSGTTGVPKGVLYSHRSTVLHSMVSAFPDSLNLSARDVILPVVPMFHVNAWGAPYAAAMVGARLVLPGPGLDGPSLVSLINREKVTLSLGVPTIWQGLLAALDQSGSGAPSLQRTVIGGSACPPSMIDTFRDRYGVDVVHAWGMTEMSPLGSVNALKSGQDTLPPEDQKALRLGQGRPPFGIEMRIVDDNGVPLPEDGEVQGELQVRGMWVIENYFRAEPDSTLTPDGWFATGDVASISPDGFMTIRDRAKDIIKSGGEWISSVELEGLAMGLPEIADAAVIAARHEKWDERPVVIAVRAPGSDISEADLLQSFEGRVAHWQIPDAVVFVETLPRNATGKILKTHLREEYGDILLGATD